MRYLEGIFDINIHGSLETGWSREYFEFVNSTSYRAGIIAGNLTYFPELSEINLGDLVSLAKSSGRFEVIRAVDIINEDVEKVSRETLDLGCVGFKLHPRIFQHSLENNKIFELCEAAKEIGVPIQICSFDDGTWNRLGLNVDHFANLSDRFPGTTFIFMHAGGHRVLDFMFIARRRSNVYLDVSFSMNYFRVDVMQKLYSFSLQSMQGKRWLFGSDYPHVNFDDAISTAKTLSCETDDESRGKLASQLFLENARQVFPRHVWFTHND